MTLSVFMGFGYLLITDISYNISEKPFTFEVKEKFMSIDETGATVVNFAEHNQSLNFILGLETDFLAQKNESFDPFDNDYIEFLVLNGDSKTSIVSSNPVISALWDDEDY